jgi:hypothetical protein
MRWLFGQTLQFDRHAAPRDNNVGLRRRRSEIHPADGLWPKNGNGSC